MRTTTTGFAALVIAVAASATCAAEDVSSCDFTEQEATCEPDTEVDTFMRAVTVKPDGRCRTVGRKSEFGVLTDRMKDVPLTFSFPQSAKPDGSGLVASCTVHPLKRGG